MHIKSKYRHNKILSIIGTYILAGLIICMSSAQLYGITIEGKGGLRFVVTTSKKARFGEPFKAVIKVYDEDNRLIRNYNKFGEDISIATTGSGVITPQVIPASSFKRGMAVVYFTYDKSETFDIIAEPIKRKPIKGAYVISEQDILEISVWQAEGLTKDVIVAPDGTISFPLIGELRVTGITLAELDKEITEKISEYVIDPQVSIMVKKVGGKRVVVFGEVKSPGIYHVAGQGTIMEVIAMAGGFTEDAVAGTVVIARGDLVTNPDVRILNLVKAVKKGKFSKEFIIEPNDIIYVPERLIPSVRYVIKSVLPGIISSGVRSGAGW